MKTYSKEQIAGRIRALQAKAGRGATEAEAQSALDKAQDLMLKYNLSQNEVDGILQKQSVQADIETFVSFPTKTFPEWKSVLANGIGYAFACKFIRETEGYASYRSRGRVWVTTAWNFRYIGTEENRLMARLMYEYLSEAIDRIVEVEYLVAKTVYSAAVKAGAWEVSSEWEKERREKRDRLDGVSQTYILELGHGRAWKHAFRLGCAYRLSERLHERRKAAEAGKSHAAYRRERQQQNLSRLNQARDPWDKIVDDLISGITDNDLADQWERLALMVEGSDLPSRFAALILAAREAGLDIPEVSLPAVTNQYALAVTSMFQNLETANTAREELTYGSAREDLKASKVKMPTRNAGRTSSSSGYSAGQAAGGKISLNKQMEG